MQIRRDGEGGGVGGGGPKVLRLNILGTCLVFLCLLCLSSLVILFS